MQSRTAYSNSIFTGCMRSFLKRCLFLPILSFCLLISTQSSGQDLPEYDEISVFLEISRLGGGEIEALIRGEEIYLPVIDLFDFLKIKNTPSSGLETISGFFINTEATYQIKRLENLIIYQDKTFNIEPGDLIRTESNLYLKSSYYGKVFGLDCVFNFRSLSVAINSKLELPFIREMRQEEMRNNLTRLKGEVVADTTVGRTYPLFKFGMADWSVIATEEAGGGSDTRLNLSLGSMIAGGEATASLYYSSADPFSEKQQYYLWRYVDNDFAPIRQILAGKISTQAISSLYNPVVGVQLTNTPTTYRRSFGSYTLSDKTEPGWIVELYVNNILVDYIKADASGFYTFEVPLVYGNSNIQLKFFGPWGEERTREQTIVIPFNFLPKNTLEYTASAGVVEDTLNSRFSRANVNYGVTRGLTIGGGAEYLSSVSSGPWIPYTNASLKLTNNLLVSGEYAHGVRTKGTLSYRLPSNLQFDLNYTWYDKNQKAIMYNYREERRATLSMPLKIGKFSSFNRFSLHEIVLPASKYTTGEWMISGSAFGVNTNLTTYALFVKNANPYFYGTLSASVRLPGGFIVMPQTQYAYTENRFLSAKVSVEKHLLEHAFMNISYEQNFRNNLKMAELGFRYDFSFAQTGASVRQSDRKTSFVQYARGSIINDRKTKYLRADNQTNVGRGGISVVPFMDLNGNSKKDPGEPRAYGLNLHTNSGRIEHSDRDTTIRIFGLEPYTNCFIELDENSFDNVAWKLKNRTYSVAVDPNILKLVEIPVIVAGEATGSVLSDKEGEMTGLGRVIVNFLNSRSELVARTLSEDDGYFSYLGLAPGEYTVQIDSAQMKKLGMTSDPGSHQFRIAGGINGDLIEGLDFVLSTIPVEKPVETKVIAEASDTIPKVVPVEKTEVLLPPDTIKVPEIKPEVVVTARKDTTYTIIHEVTEEVYTISEDSWAIQIGAFKLRSLAEKFRRDLQKNLGKKVEITVAGDYYRVRILDLPTREEVDENIIKLNKLGFKELWIIRLIAKQQQILLVTREDSLAKVRETETRGIEPAFTPDMTIQVGAFRDEGLAIAHKNRLSAILDKPVSLVKEDGWYKVRVSDFESLREMEDFVPTLRLVGVKDIWIRPIPKVVEQPVVGQPVVEQPVVEQPVVIKADSAITVAEPLREEPQAAEEKALPPEPTIALQVGVFHKERKALMAKLRITTKLKLPVEVVEQWGYYHVIVTGFYTREETYKFYPELAGIGYPGITLIQNYKRKSP